MLCIARELNPPEIQLYRACYKALYVLKVLSADNIDMFYQTLCTRAAL